MDYIIGQSPKPAVPPIGGPAKDARGGTDIIKDSTTQNFVKDVIEASRTVPVIVDFWAPWCGPCKQLGPLLEKLVRQAAGLVRLVKINVDENQELAAQMRVASIPMVYAFHRGQPVDGFAGAVPESQLRAFIERLTGGAKAPLDQALEQARALLAQGDAEAAQAAFAQVLAEDPTNPSALGGTIRALMAQGELGRAKQIGDGLPGELSKHADVASALAALDLAAQSQAGAGDTAKLREKLAANPADQQTRFDLALALLAQENAEGAIETLIDSIRRERKWNDEAARKQLVKIFDALGPADPRTVSGRRQLSSILFA